MLVTICPQCHTTFKVSDEILGRADGQVRCGRCARVFDARTSLCERPEAETHSIYDDGPKRAELPDLDSEETALAAELAAVVEPEATPHSHLATAGATAAPEDSEAARVQEADVDTSWLPALDELRRRRRWPYLSAACLLLLTLTVQLVHAYRGALVAVPVIGPAVATVYASLGLDAPANVDLGQYDLLDLTAVAEPVTADQGWLVIETRVRNNGPRIQPVPYIFVALLDRWHETVAGRYFSPDEYTLRPMADYSAMRSGSTIDAQFIIVDPGPGATGFELQICTPMEHSFLCDGESQFK